MLAIRLPEDVEKRLDDLARRTGRTRTYYAREAILEHLDGLERLYRAGDAPARVPNGEPVRVVMSNSPSFVSRWQGRFRPAEKTDERYQALAKKYL